MNQNEANEFFKRTAEWFDAQAPEKWSRDDLSFWKPTVKSVLDRRVSLEIYLDGLRAEYVQETIDKEVRAAREYIYAIIAKFGVDLTVEDYENAIASTEDLDSELGSVTRKIRHNLIAAGRMYREAVMHTSMFADATAALIEAVRQGEVALRSIRDRMQGQEHPRWMEVSKLWLTVADSSSFARIGDFSIVKSLVDQLVIVEGSEMPSEDVDLIDLIATVFFDAFEAADTGLIEKALGAQGELWRMACNNPTVMKFYCGIDSINDDLNNTRGFGASRDQQADSIYEMVEMGFLPDRRTLERAIAKVG